jgi:hypothetical protein
MKLKSFGCSFIWGSELSDVPLSGLTSSQLTWTAQLSRELNLQYECHAWPGRGNFWIANQVLDQLATDDPALYVINWTWIDRFDFINQDYVSQHWETLRPGPENHTHGAFYYRNLQCELSDKLHSLQLIKLVTMELLAAGHPFIMTYMDNLIFDQRWHTTPGMIKQQEFLKPLMLHWKTNQPQSMDWLQWAVQQGHSVTANNHLLESGHECVFQDVLARLQHDEIATASQFAVDKIKTP